MRLFFVCQRIPFPPDRGDRITTFNEIRHLAVKHEIHVFCLDDGTATTPDISGLRPYINGITVVPLSKLGSYRRALRALLIGQPLSVAAFNEPELHAAIQRGYHELNPDLIMIYSGNVAQYAEEFSQVFRIMQFADLDSQKWAQFAESSWPPFSWLYRIEQRRLLAYERGIASTFSHNLVCTLNELRDFQRLIPGALASVVGNGVDLNFYRSCGRAKRIGSMIFTGVMDYLPNIDAVHWFCEEILPIVRRRLPHARLVICGSRPVRSVRRLASREGVTVTGWVPDTRPYLDEAEIFVAPLRMARGIQNKVLEGLAMGLPVVSSQAAWRGTVLRHGEGILAADDQKTFAEHCIELLENRNYRFEMSRKARAAAESHYNWGRQLERLDQIIDTLKK